ncbi:MAG: 50S ribosomal protein L11 methyltransferase [Chloroflexi bacterium]|nr:50S ribosomal protein L11 methyltransferase [Chloroflexota bacterium]
MKPRPTSAEPHWLEVSIEAPGEFAEPLSGLFSRHSGGSVAIEPRGGGNPKLPPGADAAVIVRAWLPVDATLDDRLAHIEMGVRLISHLRALPVLQTRDVIQAEWRRQTFEPVRIGRRLLITPASRAHDAQATSLDDIVVPLEPGLAFGTGHHPTTRGCLEIVDRIIKGGESVLDIGCGSGILSIAALKLGAARTVCLDIDPDAVRAARHNLRRAGLARRAVVIQGTVPHVAARPGESDVVLANISARVLMEQARSMLECVRPTGLFVGSGYLVERKAEVHETLQSAGADIRETVVLSDWVTVVASRRHTVGQSHRFRHDRPPVRILRDTPWRTAYILALMNRRIS